jgi:DNA-binding SARP family transcriptional activator
MTSSRRRHTATAWRWRLAGSTSHAAVDREPLNGRLGAGLIRALAGAGMQEAALRHFHTVRAAMAEELGVDPDPHLLTALEAVLRKRQEPTSGSIPGLEQNGG